MEHEFEDFYRELFPQIYRATYLATRSRDMAMDTTQEAFKRALVRWKRLRKQPWSGGWVMATALNLCKRRAKQAARHVPLTGDSHHLSVLVPSADDRLALLSALQELPFRQRQATILYYLDDLPLEIVAQFMGLSEGGVKSHLAHARKRLRKVLEVRDVS